MLLMGKTHDDPFSGTGGDLKAGGEFVFCDRPGMIKPGFEVPGDAGENIMRRADDFQVARLPVDHFRQVKKFTSIINGYCL